jgi:hypothetical protein
MLESSYYIGLFFRVLLVENTNNGIFAEKFRNGKSTVSRNFHQARFSCSSGHPFPFFTTTAFFI